MVQLLQVFLGESNESIRIPIWISKLVRVCQNLVSREAVYSAAPFGLQQPWVSVDLRLKSPLDPAYDKTAISYRSLFQISEKTKGNAFNIVDFPAREALNFSPKLNPKQHQEGELPPARVYESSLIF